MLGSSSEANAGSSTSSTHRIVICLFKRCGMWNSARFEGGDCGEDEDHGEACPDDFKIECRQPRYALYAGNPCEMALRCSTWEAANFVVGIE